eukprot:TRINITY_DN3844_c0_g1_i1.p1 TRINITY_DN3844_c0_g1~~TRINITY_DN3844_c0_g1_i1.p1  ORF type:complete len:151 (+),score=12.29 TRINITY_DN3844_c0_g1_i1:97-549(+)
MHTLTTGSLVDLQHPESYFPCILGYLSFGIPKMKLLDWLLLQEIKTLQLSHEESSRKMLTVVAALLGCDKSQVLPNSKTAFDALLCRRVSLDLKGLLLLESDLLVSRFADPLPPDSNASCANMAAFVIPRRRQSANVPGRSSSVTTSELD